MAKSRRDWHERLGEALWAYRTSTRSATGATPFSLVYGSEVVLPVEIQVPSLRTAISNGLEVSENDSARVSELESLDEKRIETLQRLELYQARMARTYNKHVKHRAFKEGDLVLTLQRPIVLNH